MKMKKLLLGLAPLALVGVLASCTSDSSKDTGSVSEFNNLANLSIVSGTSLLQDSNSTVKKAKLNAVESSSASKTNTDAEKEMILKNLKLAENTLSNGVSQSKLKLSDNVNYEYEYTITATTLAGDVETYTFLFNADGKLDLLASNASDEIKKLKTLNDKDDDDDDDEDEIDVKFTGIVVLEEVEYSVKGSYESEDDEVEYSFSISLNNGDHVKIKTETEQDETEYKYESYINGSKYEYKVEYELEDGNFEIKFEEEINGIETEYKYEFFTKNNKKYVKVKFEKEVEGSKDFEQKYLIEVVVNEADGSVEYVFVA
ncbi:MAG: hypothetical protein K6E20_03090 [Acholeplasmatales bacterium]|nr:hypothetical protein [Acholeplasmatales bacterium]